MKRLTYVDIAKGIAILMVLFGHLLQNDSKIKILIYFVHMPLFFILSGMTLRARNIREFSKKRFEQMYVPYAIWALIFGELSISSILYIIYGTNESLIYARSNGMLWFLPCMFLSSLLANIVVYTKQNKSGKIKWLFCVLSAILFLIIASNLNLFHESIKRGAESYAIGLPFAIDVVSLGTAYILVGVAVRKYIDYVNEKFSLIQKFILGILLFIVCFSGLFMKYKTEPMSFATGQVGNYYIYFIVSVTSCLGIIILSTIKLPKVLSESIVWCGKNSIGLFILHRIIVYPLKDYYAVNHRFYICAIAFAVLLGFSIVGTIIINKYCPVLFGKNYKEGK